MNKASCITLFVTSALLVTGIKAMAQQPMDKMWGEQKSQNSIEAREQRGRLFDRGNYAMFVHWGLFSELGNVWDGKTYYGIGEWMMNEGMANADKDEYKAVARRFDPKDFDARKIAALAKDAGMKYVIITAKHHDGFAMFDSEADKFNIVDATPFGRDPMKELAEACREAGLGFGFYYSHNQDWTTPGAAGAPKVDSDGNPRSFSDYFYNKCLPQVEELTRNYGDIELIWFDTPGEMPKDFSEKLVETVHNNQPHALVSGRIGYGLGDYVTLGDMEVPTENIDGRWESVDVTNDTWGFAWYDNNWKTPKTILANLISTVARGGTYMLNIGPDGKGNVPEFASEALLSAGRWLKKYPDAIYGAEPSPWKHALPWGDVTRQGNRLYLAVYDWPEGGKLYLPGLNTKPVSARILGEKTQKTRFTTEGKWTVIDVPLRKPDNLISVIELTMPSEEISADPTICADPETGLKNLSVKFASTDGSHAYKSSWMEKFGEWKHVYCIGDLAPDKTATWTFDIKEPATYQVELEVRGSGPNVWRITSDENNLIQNRQGASSSFQNKPIGWIRFDKPGRHTLTVSMPEGGNAEVASISLTPVVFR